MLECAKLEGSHMDHESPTPAPVQDTLQSHPVPERFFPMLLQLCQAGAVTASTIFLALSYTLLYLELNLFFFFFFEAAYLT